MLSEGEEALPVTASAPVGDAQETIRIVSG